MYQKIVIFTSSTTVSTIIGTYSGQSRCHICHIGCSFLYLIKSYVCSAALCSASDAHPRTRPGSGTRGAPPTCGARGHFMSLFRLYTFFRHAHVSNTYPCQSGRPSVRWSTGSSVGHTFKFPLPLNISVQQSSLMTPTKKN